MGSGTLQADLKRFNTPAGTFQRVHNALGHIFEPKRQIIIQVARLLKLQVILLPISREMIIQGTNMMRVKTTDIQNPNGQCS